MYRPRTPNVNHSVMSILALVPLAMTGCMHSTVSLPRPPAKNEIRPVLAVTTFENRSNFDGQWQLGHGMADLLVAELVASKHFVLVERANLDRLIGEIDNQSTKYFRDQGKTKVGRLKNVQHFIRGVITDFSQVSSSSLRLGHEKIFGGLSGYTARVALTMTIVEVESGQIVTSVSVAGYAPAGGVYSKGEYRDVRFGGDAFFRTPLGVATRDAIRRGIHKVVAAVPKGRKRSRIAGSHEGLVIITGGRQHGHAIGVELHVLGPDKVIHDPETGDVTDVIPGRPVGRLRITHVRDKTAFAQVLKGGPFKMGQQLALVENQSASRFGAVDTGP